MAVGEQQHAPLHHLNDAGAQQGRGEDQQAEQQHHRVAAKAGKRLVERHQTQHNQRQHDAQGGDVRRHPLKGKEDERYNKDNEQEGYGNGHRGMVCLLG